MNPVLLGLAAPSAANTAGNLLGRTFNTLAKPFSAVLHAIGDSLAPAHEAEAAVGVADLQTHFAEFLTNLAERIQGTLTSAGVELTEPLELRVSEIDGSLEVVGEHPQKALIESALADDSELSRDFAEAMAMQQLLAAADEAEQTDSDENMALGSVEHGPLTAIFSSDGSAAELTFHENTIESL